MGGRVLVTVMSIGNFRSGTRVAKSFLFAQCLHNCFRYGSGKNHFHNTNGGNIMSVQAISGSSVQQYQPLQPTAQNGPQPTDQSSSGQKVKKGGGHHRHHPKAQSTGNTQTTAATSETSSTITASAVSGATYTQSGTGAPASSGGTISVLA